VARLLSGQPVLRRVWLLRRSPGGCGHARHAPWGRTAARSAAG